MTAVDLSGSDGRDPGPVVGAGASRLPHDFDGTMKRRRHGELNYALRRVWAAPILGHITVEWCVLDSPSETSDERGPDVVLDSLQTAHFDDGLHTATLAEGGVSRVGLLEACRKPELLAFAPWPRPGSSSAWH